MTGDVSASTKTKHPIMTAENATERQPVQSSHAAGPRPATARSPRACTPAVLLAGRTIKLLFESQHGPSWLPGPDPPPRCKQAAPHLQKSMFASLHRGRSRLVDQRPCASLQSSLNPSPARGEIVWVDATSPALGSTSPSERNSSQL